MSRGKEGCGAIVLLPVLTAGGLILTTVFGLSKLAEGNGNNKADDVQASGGITYSDPDVAARNAWDCANIYCAPGVHNSCPKVIRGKSGWYGGVNPLTGKNDDFSGRYQSNGEVYDPINPSAASWYWPLGTKVEVTNIGDPGGKPIIVEITDRGPDMLLKEKGWEVDTSRRIIDLSVGAFEQLAPLDQGVIDIEVRLVGGCGK